MKAMLQGRTISYAALGMALLIMASCEGGGGGGPAGPAPGGPFISNLVAGFLPQGCTLQNPNRPGTGLALSFNYTDSDGNVQGGQVHARGTFEPSGTAIGLVLGVPSNGVTITGVTEGTIGVALCVTFGSETAITITVAVADTAGNLSNILEARLSRPGGAPEMPRSDQTGDGAMEPLRLR